VGRSSGFLKGSPDKSFFVPLPEGSHNRGIEKEEKTEKVFQEMDAFIPTSERDLHRIQSEGVCLRREIGRKVDKLLTLVNRVSAPLMALRTVRSPFFRFSFAGGTDEGKIGGPA
jgi:hypothetical protein